MPGTPVPGVALHSCVPHCKGRSLETRGGIAFSAFPMEHPYI